MILRAIIIDDEMPSILAIEKVLTNYCQNVEIVGSTNSPIEGLKLINKLSPDVVFLDVEMPDMNGFELLDSINDPKFFVVFITSYDEYAIKAFKVNAVDYILKPVNIKDISQAIARVLERKKLQKNDGEQYKALFEAFSKSKPKKLQIPTADGMLCINPDEVIRFSADGRYSAAYLANGKSICFTKTLKELECFINHPNLFRIHKSHIINIDYVKKYNLTYANELELNDGTEIKISRAKKDEFIRLMVNLSE